MWLIKEFKSDNSDDIQHYSSTASRFKSDFSHSSATVAIIVIACCTVPM